MWILKRVLACPAVTTGGQGIFPLWQQHLGLFSMPHQGPCNPRIWSPNKLQFRQLQPQQPIPHLCPLCVEDLYSMVHKKYEIDNVSLPSNTQHLFLPAMDREWHKSGRLKLDWWISGTSILGLVDSKVYKARQTVGDWIWLVILFIQKNFIHLCIVKLLGHMYRCLPFLKGKIWVLDITHYFPTQIFHSCHICRHLWPLPFSL